RRIDVMPLCGAPPRARLYADRIAGGDRDYCDSHCAAAAGRATGAGSGATDAVQEQPEATGPGAAQLRVHVHRVSDDQCAELPAGHAGVLAARAAAAVPGADESAEPDRLHATWFLRSVEQPD